MEWPSLNIWCCVSGPARFFSVVTYFCCSLCFSVQKDHFCQVKYHFDLVCLSNFCPLHWDFQQGCQVWIRFSFITRSKASIVTSVTDHQTASMYKVHWALFLFCRCALVTPKQNGLFCYKAIQCPPFAFQLSWRKSWATLRAHHYCPGGCPRPAVPWVTAVGQLYPCSPGVLCEKKSVGLMCCSMGSEAGRGITLVPWPSYPGTQNKEGGFLKDSPQDKFEKIFLCLNGCWGDRNAARSRTVLGTTKPQVPPQWIWAVPKLDGQWSFWLSLSCGITF